MENYVKNSELTFNEYLSKVFSTVGIGVGITAIISYVLSRYMETIIARFAGIFSSILLGSIILELAVAVFFGFGLKKMSKGMAWFCYILYSALTGVSLSTVLYYYVDASVFVAFVATCVMFVSMALIGHNSKTDLSKFSGVAFSGLLAIILVSLLNVIFFKNQYIQWLVNYLGVVIFLFLIAYDMQKLRDFYELGLADGETGEKLAIYGAFQLYLDFINLFIRLLELFGKKRD